MRYSESEIVEDFLEHIRQAGGELHEWRMGTAPDARDPIFCQPSPDGLGEKLIYREAYTTFAAEEVVDRLARGFYLPLAPKTSPASAPTRRPGRIVFLYRPAAALTSKNTRTFALFPDSCGSSIANAVGSGAALDYLMQVGIAEWRIHRLSM